MLVIPALAGCKTSTPTPVPTLRLYGLPPVMEVLKGTEIPTRAGIVVVPEDTLLHSHGAYLEQVQRSVRR